MRETGVTVEIANTEQAAAWDGHEGDVWTEQADRYDRAGHRIWARFLEAQPVGQADRVLDIGCGAGHTTLDVARAASAGEVLGIDLSTRMLALARQRAAEQGIANATFIRGDAQVHPFEPQAHDLAISAFGAMFFSDPVAAFANVARGARSGGRLALLAWRALPENEWLMSLRAALALGRELGMPPADAPTPFSLADRARVARILDEAGFDDVDLTPIDEPMELGTDADDALEFAKTMGIVEGLTDGLAEDDRALAMANLGDLFRAHETAEGVLLGAAAWLITARRR